MFEISSFGFKYHHAEGDIATLLLWLPPTQSKVPVFATHHVGVGGLVLDGENVLVVKEKGENSQWKLPGGLSDLGEDLDTAIEREIREETGVSTKFESVLTFRHQHNSQFGRSDLYFVCLLSALSRDIKIDSEIQDARWMHINELRNSTPFPTTLLPLHMVIKGVLERGFFRKQFNAHFVNKPPYHLYLSNTVLNETLPSSPFLPPLKH